MPALSQLTRSQAAAIILEQRHRERTELAAIPAGFGAWIAGALPEYRWDYRHFVAMQAILDDITAGSIKRANVQIPIRHGKSLHNTIAYSVYRLKRDPKTKILVASYNQQQAQKFSREIRRLAIRCGVKISDDRDSAGDWETAAGGGVRAVGAGSGVASANADLIVIDDPIGSRDDAESQAKRDQVWDWMTNDLLARCQPHTAVIFTMSRWHQDDPAGRLMDQFAGRWTILDLPGEAEPDDPLGRNEFEPLWPEILGTDWLQEKRIELLEYGFASLIQGRPRPRSGGMFKWAWWQKLDDVPKGGELVRYWDMAGTRPKGGSHDPDWTAGVMFRRTAGKVSVAHVKRFRVEVAARDDMIVSQAREDVARYGFRCTYWFERQAGIGGEEASEAVERRVRALGLPVYSERAPAASKPERARPLASACMSGSVFIEPDDPGAQWHDAFRSEAADFPNGKHDDMVDAAAGAYNKLTAAPDYGGLVNM